MAFPASVGGSESLSTSWNVEHGGKLDTEFLTDDEIPMFPVDPQPVPHLKVFVDEDDMQTIRRAKEHLTMKEELAARLPPGPPKSAAHSQPPSNRERKVPRLDLNPKPLSRNSSRGSLRAPSGVGDEPLGSGRELPHKKLGKPSTPRDSMTLE